MNRRNSQRRDPNFNLIPKIQRQVTLLKLSEKDKLSEAYPMSETQIIDGVAVSKSIAEVHNQLISPSDQPMDEEKTNAVNNIEQEVKFEDVSSMFPL